MGFLSISHRSSNKLFIYFQLGEWLCRLNRFQICLKGIVPLRVRRLTFIRLTRPDLLTVVEHPVMPSVPVNATIHRSAFDDSITRNLPAIRICMVFPGNWSNCLRRKYYVTIGKPIIRIAFGKSYMLSNAPLWSSQNQTRKYHVQAKLLIAIPSIRSSTESYFLPLVVSMRMLFFLLLSHFFFSLLLLNQPSSCWSYQIVLSISK